MKKEELEAALRLMSITCMVEAATVTEDGYWEPDATKGTLELHINCNDYFAPAADSETIPWEEVPDLLVKVNDVLQRNTGISDVHNCLLQWIADKRGVENKSFKQRD